MAAEPIVIYSHKIDPAGVLQVLRGMAPGLRVEGPEDDWKTITIAGPKRLLAKAPTLSFGHDRGYYAGPGWADQMRGMQGYFSRFPENQNTQQVMLLIQSLRFSITTFPPPEPELDLDSGDPRLAYVFAVAKHLDGVIFTPSSLRDAAGRVLYGAGEPDPSARMPAIYLSVPSVPRSQRPRSEHGTEPDPDDAPPPDAGRVARRACALAAVAGRALLEQEDRADPGVEQTRQRILKWVEEIGIGEELEPDEWKILQLPPGVPPRQDTLNGTWRLEGLGVLAWALRRYDPPPYDQLVSPGELLPAVGILNAEKARAMILEPALRPAGELKQMRDRLFALHWRLTDWRVKPKAMDFATFAATAWFGPLDLTGLRLIENDLAIGNAPISRADPDAVGAAESAVMERHLAVNWLNGGSEVYSETSVST